MLTNFTLDFDYGRKSGHIVCSYLYSDTDRNTYVSITIFFDGRTIHCDRIYRGARVESIGFTARGGFISAVVACVGSKTNTVLTISLN